MAPRPLLGCFAALVLCASAGCKDKDAAKASGPEQRCDQLAKACGDTDKHVDKIVEGCKVAAQIDKSCPGKLSALYDCYEKQLCGKGDKIWAFEDLRVLADRKNACTTERAAAGPCVGK